MNELSRSRSVRGRLVLGFAAAVSILAAACGGGGGGSAAGSSAGTFATGPIQGFGSIIVNGVHYEHERAESISGDDDSAARPEDLKLGMVVEITAGRVDDNGRSVPSRINFQTALVGPIDAGSIDTTARTLTVLGQKVIVTDLTFFDTRITGGFSGLSAGQVVGVHGLFDKTTGENTATRIELKDNPQLYRLRAVVSEASAPGVTPKTFKLGGQLIDYTDVPADKVRAAVVNGEVLRARLQTTKNAAGAWVATRIDRSGSRGHDHDNHDAEVEGMVDGYESSAKFFVNGLEVNASNARFRPSADAVKNGVRVEAEGTIENGVLIASKVQVKDRSGRSRDDKGGFDDDFGVELEDVTIASVDAGTKTITLAGLDVKVRWDASTVFERGTVEGLVAGQKLEVKGMPVANESSVLLAKLIKFED